MLRPARYRLIAGTTAILAALALAACSGASGGDPGGDPGGLSARPTIDASWAGICQGPFAPGQGVPSAERFQYADEGLAEMDRILGGGDLQGASGVFFSQVHNLTHDIDGELRGKNEALARDLCSVIGQMESGFAFGGGAESMKTLASYARELMREASTLLGYSQ
ncbi:MAG: hypothetical protein Q8Q00_07180 [Dehalococcoidia bacterium]|nr:hypothetical protein [Dehalococcoidia bacterium]